MKKMYAGIFILLLLLLSSLYNVHYLDGRIDELLEYVSSAESYAGEGDFEKAAETVRRAIDTWDSMDSYTHVFIRHSETDSTSDAFCQYLGDLCAEDPGSSQGSCALLKNHLMSLITMERVSIGSIF